MFKLSSIFYNQLKHNFYIKFNNTNNKAHDTNTQARTGNGPNGHGSNGIDPERARANGLEPERFTTLSYHFFLLMLLTFILGYPSLQRAGTLLVFINTLLLIPSTKFL